MSYDTRSLKPQVFFTVRHLHYKTGLTLWSRVLLQTPVFPQVVKKSTMFDITRNLIIMLQKKKLPASILSRLYQSTFSILFFFKFHSNIIHHLRLGLPSGLFPSHNRIITTRLAKCFTREVQLIICYHLNNTFRVVLITKLFLTFRHSASSI